jgi:hypothetical protein
VASLSRIRFKNTDSSNTYDCPINPRSIDIKDSTDYKMQNVLDAAPIRIVAAFDGRPRILTWDSFEYSHTAFQAMLSELRTYKGEDKRLDLRDIDGFGLGEKQIHVDDVATTTLAGGLFRLVLTVTYHYII